MKAALSAAEHTPDVAHRAPPCPPPGAATLHRAGRRWAAVLGLCALAGLIPAAPALAVDAVVVNVVGTVAAQRPDGAIRVLAKDSELVAGEIVSSEEASSARLRFADGSFVTLRPSSRLVIEAFAYDEANPDGDAAHFNLLRGGMRAITGAVGSRNPEAHRTSTAAGTIGIRGTDYAVLLCFSGSDGCELLTVPAGLLSGGIPADGLYLSVFDGHIFARNLAGELDYLAPASGFVRDNLTLPIVLPEEPGLRTLYFTSAPGPGRFLVFGEPDHLGAACLVR